MTREQVKKHLPLLRAYAEGKTVQWRYRDEWIDYTPNDANLLTTDEWRIKPEPKLRPWKPEEVPVGGLIRWKKMSADTQHTKWLITCCDIYSFTYGNSCRKVLDNSFEMDDVMNNMEYSLDNGKTWHPCGVEE